MSIYSFYLYFASNLGIKWLINILYIKRFWSQKMLDQLIKFVKNAIKRLVQSYGG